VRVGPIRVRDHRNVDPRERAVGLILDVDADFVFHDVALVVDARGVDREALHAICLGPENRLEGVGRDEFVVVRKVEACRAVENAAVAFDQLDELELAEVARALEHQMFKEVGEARAVARFRAEADAIVDADGNGWGGAVAGHHDPEAIAQREVLDRHMELRREWCDVLGDWRLFWRRLLWRRLLRRERHGGRQDHRGQSGRAMHRHSEMLHSFGGMRVLHLNVLECAS
jgi:hypothetical protein